MSVRAGLLLLLGETEAYGLQLHGELEERTARPGGINVGQVYSTLDRLVASGLVETAGSTADGLPLYRATAEGRAESLRWLGDAEVASGTAWADMVFKVLLAASLERVDVSPVIEGYRWAWGAAGADDAPRTTADTLTAASRRARSRLAEAALAWIDDLADDPGGTDALRVPLRDERPRRGRRPATPVESTADSAAVESTADSAARAAPPT